MRLEIGEFALGKLVRDNILELIRTSGRTAVTQELNDSEFAGALLDKLAHLGAAEAKRRSAVQRPMLAGIVDGLSRVVRRIR